MRLSMVRMMQCLAALYVCMAPPVQAAPKTETVTLSHQGAQVSVTSVQPNDRKLWSLHIEATRDGRTVKWDYAGAALDPDSDVKAEIQDFHGAPLLFVHTYSGGSRCCWTLLAMDLQELMRLGEVLESQGPIALRADQDPHCELAAKFYSMREDQPVDSRQACFDGKIFRENSRGKAATRIRTDTQQTVTFTGKLRQERYWGPPGFGQNPKMDSTFMVWVLALRRPVVFYDGGEDDAARDVTLKSIELMADPPLDEDLKPMVGKIVVASGILGTGVTGADMTPVTLRVRKVRVKDGGSRR